MSRRKDLQWAIWKSGTRRLDALLWELGRVQGLREGAGYARVLQLACPSQMYPEIRRQQEATAKAIFRACRRLMKRIREGRMP